MKNLFKIAFVVMWCVQTIKAQELPEVQIPNVVETPSYFAHFNFKHDNFKIIILLSKKEGDRGVLNFKLKDEQGNLLYQKYMDKFENRAAVYLNLDEMPDGEYVFEMSNRHGKTFKTFLKDANKPIVKYNKQLIALN